MTEKDKTYTALLNKQIDEYHKETMHLEFKSNYQTAEKLGQYISALSNGACLSGEEYGYLYFGIEDESLEVKGTDFECANECAKGNQALEITLRRDISPKINFKIESFNYNGNIRIVRFKIPAAKEEPTC